MKLVYFVGPYDLLDKKTKTSKPMTIEGECVRLNHVYTRSRLAEFYY